MMRPIRALLLAIVVLGGCSYGGGTIGTGLPGGLRSTGSAIPDAMGSESSDSMHAATRGATPLGGSLHDGAGLPVSGLNLRIQSQGATQIVTTDSDGRFSVTLPLTEGSPVFISLGEARNAERVRWVYHASGELRLRLGRDHRLTIEHITNDKMR